MTKVLMIGLGGAFGSMARYLLANAVARAVPGPFPWGTFAVNVAGCLAMGAVAYFALDRASLGDTARLFVAAGLLGGFTTFSAFGAETVDLLDRRSFALAAAYASASVLVGLGAFWAGRQACRAALGVA
jgi:CrcB protein